MPDSSDLSASSTAPASPVTRLPHPHLWPDTAQVDDVGRLRIAGIDIAALARENGTPLYLFDEATLRAQCRTFRQVFAQCWPISAIAYAGKAYLSPALCAILRDEGLELDAVSAGEIATARRWLSPGAHPPPRQLQARRRAGLCHRHRCRAHRRR